MFSSLIKRIDEPLVADRAAQSLAAGSVGKDQTLSGTVEFLVDRLTQDARRSPFSAS